MERIDLSIVIVNYNVREYLVPCLNSIYSSTNDSIKTETIVVDNNSSDDSIETIKRDFPQTIIIQNTYNAGFPKANNQGFKIAKGKYILMLNPDTEITDNALEKLISYIEKNSDISIIAPQLINTDGSFQSSVWRFPKLWYIFCETNYLKWFLGKKNYSDKDLNKPFIAESFSGAAILFNHDILIKMGMLDETMFWIEDIDFCFRANRAGLKMLYYPIAKVKHHIGQSAKKNYNISISNQVVNKIKFFKKHYSTFQWLIVIMISLYGVLIKLIVFGILSPFKRIYYRKAKAYLYTLPLVFNPPLGMK